MASTTERTTSETIFQACLDLHNAGRQISRPVLKQITGLSMMKIDDHVTRMLDAESPRLRRVANGIFEIIEQFPSNRVISKTVLPNGMVKMEMEDVYALMTPSEAGIWWQLLHGEGTAITKMVGDRDVQDKVARLEREAQATKKRLEDQAREIARLRQQPQLAFE